MEALAHAGDLVGQDRHQHDGEDEEIEAHDIREELVDEVAVPLPVDKRPF